MFLIVKLFFISVGFFFLFTFIAGLSLAVKIRDTLRNPFVQQPPDPPPPPGKGDIIEGEFQVLGEKKRQE